MHIIGFVLAILGAIGIWYWRIQAARQGAEALGGLAKTATNLPRRLSFLSKSRKGGIEVIEDSREAAAIMMVLVAEAGGMVTQNHQDLLNQAAEELFEFDEAEADALFAHAAWSVRQGPTGEAIMARMSGVVLRSEGMRPQDLVDFDEVLVALTEASGEPRPDQMRLLQIFRDKAGIRA